MAKADANVMAAPAMAPITIAFFSPLSFIAVFATLALKK
jgi:hypothetical protein